MNVDLRQEISTKCAKFSNEYHTQFTSAFDDKFTHDATWKESCSKQKKVVDDILTVL